MTVETSEEYEVEASNITTARTLIKVMRKELDKWNKKPVFMVELRRLRGNENYAEIKPLIRRTIDHIQSLENTINSLNALIKVVVNELNTRPTLEDDNDE
tara:strand:- start:256 stop:555 length:300 start_codon:yes stop_codon:yes gene_type:complete